MSAALDAARLRKARAEAEIAELQLQLQAWASGTLLPGEPQPIEWEPGDARFAQRVPTTPAPLASIRTLYDWLVRQAQYAHRGYATNVALLAPGSEAEARDAFQWACMRSAALQACHGFTASAKAYEHAALQLAKQFPHDFGAAVDRLYVDVRLPPTRPQGHGAVGVEIAGDLLADLEREVGLPDADAVAAVRPDRDPAGAPVDLGDGAGVHRADGATAGA